MNFQRVAAVVSGGASGLGLGLVRHIINGGGKAAILDVDQHGVHCRL